jgi:YbbR domain-containing protein
MISKNLGLKIASLFIAVVLAYDFHSASNASVVSIYVPVELKNIPVNRVVVSPSQRSVQVTIRGPSFLIGPVASSPPPLRARLPDMVKDRALVNFQASDLSLPHSIEVLSIEPSQIEFGLEAVELYEVPVKVVTTGELPDGLVLEGIDANPKSIPVQGPRSDVKTVRFLETEPLNLSTLSESGEFLLKVHTSNPKVVPSKTSVLARVRLTKPPTEREFDARPIEIRLSRGAPLKDVSPQLVVVSVSGPPAIVSEITEEKVVPFVRLSSNVNPGSELPVKVDVPAGVKVLSVSPASVRVVASKRGR